MRAPLAPALLLAPAAALATLVALASSTRAGPGAPPPLAIKDARIVVGPGKTLAKATIVFRDGLVDAVGEGVVPPADAIVEDGKGLTVYAGWIDAGAAFPLDLGSPEGARAREGTPPPLADEPPIAMPESRKKGIRSSLDVATTALLENDRRAQERRGGFTVALAVPPRGFLAGTSTVLALGEGSRRRSILEPRAFLHASLHGPEGNDWHTYPHSLMGAHAHIRQTFSDAKWVRELEERAARGQPGPRPAVDPDLEALWPALDRKLRVAWQVDSAEDAERALALGKELGLRLCVTEGRRAGKIAPRLRAEGIPAIVSLAWGPKPKPAAREVDPAPKPRKGQGGKPLQGPFSIFHLFVFPAAMPGDAPAIGPGPAGPPSDPTQESRTAFLEKERHHDEEVHALRDYFLAGVRVAVTSQGLEKPSDVRDRLREAIKAGLPEEAALRALTSDAAHVLGLESKLGTLEPGKLAFATVLSGGGFADEKAKVAWVVVDGERVDVERSLEDAKLTRLAGRWKLEAGTFSGALVLEALPGAKLTGRVEVEGKEPAPVAEVKVEGERLKLALPPAVTGQKKPAAVDVRWVEPDLLEGTATFDDGPRLFRARRSVP